MSIIMMSLKYPVLSGVECSSFLDNQFCDALESFAVFILLKNLSAAPLCQSHVISMAC